MGMPSSSHGHQISPPIPLHLSTHPITSPVTLQNEKGSSNSCTHSPLLAPHVLVHGPPSSLNLLPQSTSLHSQTSSLNSRSESNTPARILSTSWPDIWMGFASRYCVLHASTRHTYTQSMPHHHGLLPNQMEMFHSMGIQQPSYLSTYIHTDYPT